MFAAFPDTQRTVEDQVADDEKGGHANGRIEEWQQWDSLGLMPTKFQ